MVLLRENEARDRAWEILSSTERDRNQRMAAEDRLVAAEVRAGRDAQTITLLRLKRDDLC